VVLAAIGVHGSERQERPLTFEVFGAELLPERGAS